MHHIVNFGLLFSFITLVLSGALRFVEPFSIATTRIHIVFGLVTILLVGCHLAGRLKYFQRSLSRQGQSGPGKTLLIGICLLWLGLLWLALKGGSPTQGLIDLSYESRHRAAIVRSSPLAGAEPIGQHTRIIARDAGVEGDVAVSLTLQLGQFLTQKPSVAVWAETSTGSMIETLYLDDSLAYTEMPDWGGRATSRHQILPIWRHRYTLVSGVNPQGEVDAVTGATDSHRFTLDEYLVLGKDKSFVLCVEINLPADPNKTYSDEHLGQPSLLYTAYIEPDQKQRYTLLQLTGHGGGAEKGGAIHYDLDTITTALEYVDLLLANVQYISENHK
ncbi:MAG: hypothetical protein HOH33_13100 [Verrucomicrobia bacterium]|jgi:hypothetical protein|nr:hypothetical protein [Verrucomicrobiota bacterium]